MFDMKIKISERYLKEIEEGDYDTYMIDNQKELVYIVWW